MSAAPEAVPFNLRDFVFSPSSQHKELTAQQIISLVFRLPTKVPGCECANCTRKYAFPEQLEIADQYPSPFTPFKLVRTDPVTGQHSDLSQSEIEEIERNHPQIALWKNTPTPGAPSPAWAKAAVKTVRQIKKLKLASFFLAPVDYVALNLLEYPNIVKHPMDLQTVESKLVAEPCGYETPEEWINDMRTIWRNAYIFNDPQSLVVSSARELSIKFELMLQEL